MPELPEVETFMRTAVAHLGRSRILAARAVEDRLVFEDQPADAVAETLTGRQIQGFGRKGKYGWLILDRPPFPIFHFGMTGSFEPFKATAPAFTKLELHTRRGSLAFTSRRRLARVLFADAPLLHPRIRKLGPDAFTQPPTLAEFRGLLAGKRAPVKSVLLDQTFMAGIGNWIADEVLFQAGIAPYRPGHDLSAQESSALLRCIRKVLEHAVEVGADDERFPQSWLFHRRWGRKAGMTTSRGEKIEYLQLGGRTSAWVPGRQR